MRIANGTMVDRYHVMDVLGEGGMAIVYKAMDTRLKREVALKVIRSEVFPPAILEQVLTRFEREATALARMQHSNILTVFDYGEYNQAPYLVSEYLAGGTLRNRMGKQIPPAEAAWLLTPVADALTYAHSLGVVHRDVKPANVLFTTTATPKLADFGIARLLGMDASTQLTGTGMGMGTPAYMAPEQWHGDVSPAVDTYAMGVVFFEMLTGRLPYEAQTPVELAIMIATKPLPDPRQYAAHLPDAVVEILRNSLQNKPGDRYASMADFAQTLHDLQQSLYDQGAGMYDEPLQTGMDSNLPPTEIERPTGPRTPTGGVRRPTPYPAFTPPPGMPSPSQPVTPPPPTYPAGLPPKTSPSGFDSGATFQTPVAGISGDRTSVQTPAGGLTPAGGQAYPTPPPYAAPAPPRYTPPAGTEQAPPAARRGSRKNLLVVSILVILCCLVGGGASWYAYQQYTTAMFEAKVATGLALTAAVERAAELTAAAETETARQATAQAATRQTEAAQMATAQAEATRAAVVAAAAATQAAIPVPLQSPLNWPVVYQSDFANDTGEWVLGEEEDDFAIILRTIRSGMLNVEMTAKKGVASRTTPDVPSSVNTDTFNEFYLSVDVVMSGPDSMQGGVIFCYDTDSGYYSFIVNRSGEFSMWSYSFVDSKWTNVVESTVSTAISPNGINHIEVVARGNRYYIYVNRYLAVDITSDLQSGGWVGLMSELSTAGDEGEWRYDNFIVRSP